MIASQADTAVGGGQSGLGLSRGIEFVVTARARGLGDRMHGAKLRWHNYRRRARGGIADGGRNSLKLFIPQSRKMRSLLAIECRRPRHRRASTILGGSTDIKLIGWCKAPPQHSPTQRTDPRADEVVTEVAVSEEDADAKCSHHRCSAPLACRRCQSRQAQRGCNRRTITRPQPTRPPTLPPPHFRD